MSTRYSINLALLLIMITATNCKKLVDIGPPVNKLVTTSVFDNDNTAIAAQLSIYAQMQSIPWTIEATTALSSDEFTNHSPDQNSTDLYLNALNAQTDASSLPWALAYKIIYQENAILENIKNSTVISNNVKRLLTGEAEFVRAYWYFYLINLYGDVPLVTTTDYKTNSTLARASKISVYQQIVIDLQNARDLLSSDYLDATDTVKTSDRVRPTTWAASALLARAYLYNNQYDSAEAQASILINNTSLFGLSLDLNAVFLKNGLEAIWQIMPPSSGAFTVEGNYFILTTPPGADDYISHCCTISPQLLNAFEPGDKRRINWIDSLQDGTNTWYFPYKYKDNSITKPSGSFNEYSMVLRLGEQYLIRAEARAQQNELSEAISDINMLRTRAGLNGLNNSLSQTQIITAVAHERQVELFTEGQRWLDIKRTGTVDALMENVTTQKGGVWNTNQQLYPLITTDVQIAPTTLIQNPGY